MDNGFDQAGRVNGTGGASNISSLLPFSFSQPKRAESEMELSMDLQREIMSQGQALARIEERSEQRHGQVLGELKEIKADIPALLVRVSALEANFSRAGWVFFGGCTVIVGVGSVIGFVRGGGVGWLLKWLGGL